MTKIHLLTIAVVTLLVLNLCVVGFLIFEKPKPFEGPHPPFGIKTPKDEIIEMLHFDEDQINKYEELIHQHRTAIRILDEEIQKAKGALYLTLQTESSPQTDSLYNQLTTLQKEVEKTHYAHFVEIKKLCKPEQLERFNELTLHLAQLFDRNNHEQRPPIH